MRDDVLVDLVRGELLESQHRGSLIILDAHGEASVSLGEVASPMFPRSSNKPMQAVGLVEAGLDIEPELLALAAASHSGGPEHVAGVERLLQLHGRSTADLRCTIGMPIGEPERRNYVRNGGEPARIVSDCSGKHAAFLATAVINGWALDSYLDASHPVQRACRSAVERLAGEPVAAVSVDGCGAPLFALTLTGLARAFRSMAVAAPELPEGRVATAMRVHPGMVGGQGRDVTVAMQQVPGLIAKDGAEAVLAMALPDGRAMALKISDGARRAVQVVLAAVIDAWGFDSVCLPRPEVLGGGRPVGTLAESAQLRSALDAVRA